MISYDIVYMICTMISESKLLYHWLFHTYDIIYDIDYDLNYDIIGQTFDIAVCRIVVVSP